MYPIFGKIGERKNLLDLCAIGLIVGGATHSSHLFQPIEFRIWYYLTRIYQYIVIYDFTDYVFAQLSYYIKLCISLLPRK